MKKEAVIFSFLFFFHLSAFTQLLLEVESGLAIPGYNRVMIPNDPSTATKFDFNEDFDIQGPVFPLRVILGYTFAQKNHISALYAPLGINYEGPAPFDIRFQGTLFPEGDFIEGFYKFNSYRLTYRRDLLLTEHWTLGLGFTAKIRDARIKLSSDGLSAKKDDLGFVPLLRILVAYKSDPWMVMLKGDGLAGGPGRAFDFFLGTRYRPGNHLYIKAGYRILEGGADVSEVYNFALINFAVLGIGLEL